MKAKLLKQWPEMAGKVMTVKGFIKGMSPSNEDISEEEARMEDAGGKDIDRKLELYVEHERLAEEVAKRLIDLEDGKAIFSVKNHREMMAICPPSGLSAFLLFRGPRQSLE